ncbi:MAG: aminopeptidase P family protein [Bacteroides sp.]|nr:aminopeptidase P family protein [Bacteroides sp.]
MKLIATDMMQEINLRMESIINHMSKNGIGAILVASGANIYYTTLRMFRGYVYIPLVGDPIWFVVKPNIFEKENHLIPIHKPEMIPGELEKLGYAIPENIGLEFDALSYSEITRLKGLFPNSQICNGSVPLSQARMVKTDWEIDQIKQDAMHQSEVYRRVVHCYKENMTDLELQIEIERVLRLEGCLGFTRTAGSMMDINMGSVIAGDNADAPSPFDFSMGGAGVCAALPVGANGTTLKPGETVMVDMSGAFNGYQSDMTRVWRVGDIPEIAYKAHDCSIKILRACENIGKPGIKVSDLYAIAEKIVAEEGLQDYFMGHSQKAKFIGHGVGIELNELPVITARSKVILEKNMVMAIEPKFVIPEVGAVGIENTYVVTSEGLQSLTIFPDEIQEL